MFIGHFGVALAAKRAAPRASLGTLLMASQFIDLLWPLLLLLGIERVRIEPGNTAFTPLDFYHYPVSHSLLTVLGWGVALAAAYFLVRRNARAALVMALAVISHWALDAIVHRPDLPLAPGSTRYVGLGLWNSVPLTLIVETGSFAAGVWLYAATTRARDRVGSIGLWVFVVVLLLIYLGNVFGPPPPSSSAIAWVGLAQWIFVALAYWIDRRRTLART